MDTTIAAYRQTVAELHKRIRELSRSMRSATPGEKEVLRVRRKKLYVMRDEVNGAIAEMLPYQGHGAEGGPTIPIPKKRICRSGRTIGVGWYALVFHR